MRFEDDLELERAMVVFAHPDDAEWMAGGTVAQWVDAGVDVVYVLVTNGASGETPAYPDMTRERLVGIRAEEQRAAADVLGVQHLVMLGLEDGYVEPDLETRKTIAREIRRWRPDIVITHDATQRTVEEFYIQHPDHLAVGELVMRSINPDASSRLMFPELEQDEGLEKFLPKALMLGSFFEGNCHVDITETFDRKLEALLKHACQIGDPDGLSSWVREQFKKIGARGGGEYAEAFRLFRLGEV